jgi:hypothetical protein
LADESQSGEGTIDSVEALLRCGALPEQFGADIEPATHFT